MKRLLAKTGMTLSSMLAWAGIALACALAAVGITVGVLYGIMQFTAPLMR